MWRAYNSRDTVCKRKIFLIRNFLKGVAETYIMNTGWFKNVFSSVLLGNRHEAIGQGAKAFEKKTQVHLEDPEEISFFEEARRKSLQLLTFIPREGMETLDRFWMKIGVKKKVKKNIAPFYDTSEIVEDITETLRQASEADPFFKRLFR